ncbi:hypothetical protein FA13DRAFT_1812362 [Coprinellus micaceus]|uniref:Nephrocystin 3-like N-terminal domain-containing protein n=1 Tax=Coprinellus micaceus TaxID=71717 RepID=A0A4Y7THT7_COPMI|nr:hypothetical protein FA13DRAFT_1812362 [Coprinellus micaceus]
MLTLFLVDTCGLHSICFPSVTHLLSKVLNLSMAHYFQGANRFHIANLSISHSTHTFNAIEKLAEHASAGASFDSKQRYPAPQCFPGTQGNVLEDIRTWFSRTPTDQPILWLYGPTGMGKTTIAQTVAEEVEALAKLVATFFFSRSSPDRNDASKFVATIALQMALKIPQLLPLIEQAIHKDITIFLKAPHVQLEKLIIEPCKSLQNFGAERWLIIVDGLDECIGPPGSDREREQELVLNLLYPLFSTSFPFRLLLCSRAEEWLKIAFDEERLFAMSMRLPLFPTSKLNEDIWHYIDKGFEGILHNPHHARSMRSVQQPWPSMNIRHRLVENACGQFVYVATAIRFIDNRWTTPPEQLKKLVPSIYRPEQGPHIFSDLETLYMDILKACPDRDAMVQSLGDLMCVHIMEGCDLLALLDSMFGRFDGETCLGLRGVHSVVDVDNFATTKRTVFHASFQDFITSPSRAGEFFIDAPLVHGRFLSKCLDILELREYGSALYKYAFNAWRSHHLRAARVTEDLADRILAFDFKLWLMDSCLPDSGAPVHWFPRLSSWVWGHGLFQHFQIDAIPHGSLALRLKALRCAYHLRSSYEEVMVWFLDNDKSHRDGRFRRLLDACFSPMEVDGKVDCDHLSVVTQGPAENELDYPVLTVRGEPSMVDLVAQGLIHSWNPSAAPESISAGELTQFVEDTRDISAWEEELSPTDPRPPTIDKAVNTAHLACGVQLHIFPRPLLAFLAAEGRSKHHFYVSQDRIQSVLRRMLEDPSGLSMIEKYASALSQVENSSRGMELPFSPWFDVLCLFIELASEGSSVVGELLKAHGPNVLAVLDALDYFNMQKRFKRAAERHLPEASFVLCNRATTRGADLDASHRAGYFITNSYRLS